MQSVTKANLFSYVTISLQNQITSIAFSKWLKTSSGLYKPSEVWACLYLDIYIMNPLHFILAS